MGRSGSALDCGGDRRGLCELGVSSSALTGYGPTLSILEDNKKSRHSPRWINPPFVSQQSPAGSPHDTFSLHVEIWQKENDRTSMLTGDALSGLTDSPRPAFDLRLLSAQLPCDLRRAQSIGMKRLKDEPPPRGLGI